jgi:CubicO group peptidase (beta-lactamase class C family)
MPQWPKYPSRRIFIVGASAGLAGLCNGHALAVHAASPLPRDRIERLLRQHRVPGVSFATFEHGEIALAAAYGKMRSGGDLVTPHTRFQAASLSKTANALCVMTLVRDGKLGLDDTVNQYLIGWQLTGKGADSVTVRMLLSHTGGTTVHGFDGYKRDAIVPSLLQILKGVAPANSGPVMVDNPPGRKFCYSGGGIVVLQKLVGDVAGGSYDDIVDERVLRPLTMSNSSMRQPPLARNLASGHTSGGEPVYMDYHIYPELAAAGLWTTPSDVARMVMAIVESASGGREDILPKKLARQMMVPVKSGAGLGVFVDGAGRIKHEGVNLGFRAIFVADPKQRRGKVIMSNGEDGKALNNQILERI